LKTFIPDKGSAKAALALQGTAPLVITLLRVVGDRVIMPILLVHKEMVLLVVGVWNRGAKMQEGAWNRGAKILEDSVNLFVCYVLSLDG
jgi:hypothetical protein